MRCARCGNENPDQNRFCGMCGASLLSAPVAQTASQRVAAPAATAASPALATEVPAPASDAPARVAPVTDDAPIISGPSFLGLSDPVPSKRASLSLDHDAPASGNLDYLLAEEGAKSSGGGKFFLILAALVLAGGLGYLRWKDQRFGWLGTSSKPSAATQTATDTTSSPAANTTAPAQAPVAVPPATQPSTDSPAPTTTNTAGTPASGNPATSPAPATAATPDADKPSTVSDTAANADQPSPQPTPKEPPKKQPPSDNSAAATPAASDHAKPAPSLQKPRAAAPPAPPADPVAEAQKYLYGRSVAQDCERGMRLLRPAANQANPKAMIEMGALYSAGLCTPHDLPTAYRWFALALRKDPENEAVQADLQKLWGEMTPPERQLAIKLTQ